MLKKYKSVKKTGNGSALPAINVVNALMTKLLRNGKDKENHHEE